MNRSFSSSVRTLCRVAVCTALIAVCSFVSIPMPGVPFTLQSFAVWFAVLFLGSRNGAAAIALYLALGAFGVPVFSGFRGGIGALLGPTGGFLLGFLLLAPVAFLCRYAKKYSVALTGVLGQILLYAAGLFRYVVVTKIPFSGLPGAFLACVAPFILPDALKFFLAYRIAQRLSSAFPRQ